MAGTPYLAGTFNAAAGGSLTPAVSLTTSIAIGDTISVGILATAGTINAVVDSQGNSYSLVANDSNSSGCQNFVWEAYGAIALVAGTDTITVTYSSSSSVQGIVVVGDNNVAPTADIAVQGHGTSASPSIATGVLAQAEEHVITFITNLAAGGVPGSFTGGEAALGHVEGGTVAYITAADVVVNATTSVTTGATITSTTWAICSISHQVSPVMITNAVLSNGVQNLPYSQTLSATGAVSPYTWSITSGSLPTGVTLSGAVISGTPTVAGSYTVTVQATDAHSVIASVTYSFIVFPAGASGAPAISLPDNMLAAADSDFEVSGFSWSSHTNANAPVRTSVLSFTGSNCLYWTVPANGYSSIAVGTSYPVVGNTGYVVSGYMLAAWQGAPIEIGVNWYDNTHTLIGNSVNGISNANTGFWQPLNGAVTSPANAAFGKIYVASTQANAGDLYCLDLFFMAPAFAQVLIDWTNPCFNAASSQQSSSAGNSFMDCTPFCRLDGQGISLSRGRQDGISEIQPGSGSFILQNDTGVFTRFNTNSFVGVLNGNITLFRRVQVNTTDQNGVWNTRFDGAISEIDYSYENTGNTCQAIINVTDVLAFLNRQPDLSNWTESQVLLDAPLWHWPFNDAGNAGSAGLAAETGGNNGPPMRTFNGDSTSTGTITWQDTTGGIETLADTVSARATFDGSEFWTPYNNVPSSLVRGLDAGVAGPYTAPIPSIYLTPKLSAQSNQNTFLGNLGWQLQTTLPFTLATSNTTHGSSSFGGTAATTFNYAFECWVTMDPGVLSHASGDYGPYIAMSFGSSRTGCSVSTGLWLNAGAAKWETASYQSPPALPGKSFNGLGAPTAFQSSSAAFPMDSVQLPHHVVMLVLGAPGGAGVFTYIDGVQIGNAVGVPSNMTIDTICVGGAFGGGGNWWGNVGMVSVYNYILSQTQLLNHAQFGQYGNWEMTTDDCIAALSNFAGTPPFWDATSAQENGLAMTEYQDITGNNALTSMQLFEQAEAGLLYVNALGQLAFQTRDWRMGHGAPDLLLPPDSFDAPSLNMEVVDQFLSNENAISTQVFQTGASYVNANSQNEYGVYAINSVNSPLQLPLITWSRAFASIGVNSYDPDPNLNDLAAWQANARSEPFTMPASATIDMLTCTSVTISELYALDISSMVAPSGTLPASFPNATGANEWFIEGINETISQSNRNIVFFTSPAFAQRAWIPGDSVYGILGQTSLIGLSQADLSPTQADGKDVSHDGGPPYWAPTFAKTLNANTGFESGSKSPWVSHGTGAVTGVSQTWSNSGLWSFVLNGDGTHGPPGIKSENITNVVPGVEYTIGGVFYSPQGLASGATLEFDWFNGVTANGTSTVTVAVQAGNPTPIVLTAEAPASTTNFNCIISIAGTPGATVQLFGDDVFINPGTQYMQGMNNPASNGHEFIGAADIRGIANNLSMMLQPPMMCASTSGGNVQSIPNGVSATTHVTWDTLYFDTAGGMGAVPGWPTWYLVTVPGFYEMDVNFLSAQSGGNSGDSWMGWIIVAKAAAQALAAGTGNPDTVANFVCPMGEMIRQNSSSVNVCANPTVRMYLGLGDMVAIGDGQNTGSAENTGTAMKGSHFSMRWLGYGRQDDRVRLNTSINVPGIVTDPSPVVPQQFVAYNWATYSYYGAQAPTQYQQRTKNSNVYQGCSLGQLGVTGSQQAQISMFNGVHNNIGGSSAGWNALAGFTIDSCTLTCHNFNSWANSVNLMLGLVYDHCGAASWIPKNNANNKADIANQIFNEGQRITFVIPTSFVTAFVTGGAKGLYVGNGNTSKPSDFGWWQGGPNNWIMRVNYH